jgi:GNAT superfamily N-acetyltransferase
MTQSLKSPVPITVQPLVESQLPEAARICSAAFGTFLGVPDPETFFADRDIVHGRWHAKHVAGFGAVLDEVLVGSNFVTNWGSVGFFGPLTVRPDLWDKGVGKRLVAAAVDCFDSWGTKHAGLFTFSESTKHLALYEKFGFCARFLTSIMTVPTSMVAAGRNLRWVRYSDLGPSQQAEVLEESRVLTDALYSGFDVRNEIRVVQALDLGDTVLLRDKLDRRLDGFAICHYGPRSEAGKDRCYIKFGAVREGPGAAAVFTDLLDSCAGFSARAGITTLVAGVNLGRYESYRCMLSRGFRAAMQGVAMHRPNEAGYSRPDVFVIDDWR